MATRQDNYRLQQNGNEIVQTVDVNHSQVESEVYRSAEDDYEPIDVPQGYPKLNFRPLILKSWVLFITFIFFTACLAGLVTLIVLDRVDPKRVRKRVGSYTAAIEYLPAVTGTVTTVWYRALSRSYLRILPFVMMASVTITKDGQTMDRATKVMDLLARLAQYGSPWNSLAALPFFIREGYGTAPLVLWTQVITALLLAPLKAGLLQATLDESGWLMTVSKGIACILSVIYLFLIISVVGIFFRLRQNCTGLKWEPSSLAAQVALLNKLNRTDYLEGTEYCHTEEAREMPREWARERTVLRLGYWRQRGTNKIVHGIRFLEDASSSCKERNVYVSPDKHSYTDGGREGTRLGKRCVSHKSPGQCHPSIYRNEELPLTKDGTVVCSPEYIRFRYLSYVGNFDVLLLLLESIAVVCIILSAINISKGTIYHSIPKIIKTPGTFDSYVSSLQRGLLYNFLPALPFVLFSIVFINTDLQLRVHSPLHHLSTPHPPEKNMLLDYLSPDPATLLFRALSNKHYRIAWHSFLALVTNYSVIVAGRIFNRQIVDKTMYMVIAPTNLYAAMGILCFYAAILPFSRPPLTYAYPRPWSSILDTMSFVYDSRVLSCPEFDVQDRTDEEKHLHAKCILSKRKFCFGMYYGVDGKRHMGVAPAEESCRDDGERAPAPDLFAAGWAVGWPRSKWWSKRPQIVPIDADEEE